MASSLGFGELNSDLQQSQLFSDKASQHFENPHVTFGQVFLIQFNLIDLGCRLEIYTRY